MKKIEIKPNQFVWVDENAEIKEGDWHLKSDRLITSSHIIDNDSKKIIAASQELNLEGVPTYVELLAANLANPNVCKTENWIDGYQTAEKELPTWDDVRKAIKLAQLGTIKNGRLGFLHDEPEQIIEQLKQNKK